MFSSTPDAARAPRPRPLTVFAAAIVAGTAVAVGVNVVLEAHLAQARPQVESEVILVAMRGLPAGSPVTVWDVALRDWPKAMVPAAALRVSDDLDDLVVRHPLREGQPVLATQVARVSSGEKSEERPAWSIVSSGTVERAAPEQDLWDPGPPSRPAAPPRQAPPPTVTTPVAKVAVAVPRALEVQPVVVPSREVVAPATPTTPPPAVAPVAVAPPAAPPATTAPVATPAAEPILAVLPPAAPAASPTPVATVEPATPAAAAAIPAAPTAPPSPIAVAPAPEPAPSAAVAKRTAPAVRGTRPHPSAVQFLSVPDPEAFLADDDPEALTRRRATVTPRGGRDVSVVERDAAPTPGLPGEGAAAPQDAPRTAQTAPRPARPTAPATRPPQRASRGAARGYRAY